MINVIKQEIDMEESLKKRLEIICDFCNTTPTFINGSIRRIDETSPHLHIVSVPIKYKNKNGMKKQVGKGELYVLLVSIKNIA